MLRLPSLYHWFRHLRFWNRRPDPDNDRHYLNLGQDQPFCFFCAKPIDSGNFCSRLHEVGYRRFVTEHWKKP